MSRTLRSYFSDVRFGNVFSRKDRKCKTLRFFPCYTRRETSLSLSLALSSPIRFSLGYFHVSLRQRKSFYRFFPALKRKIGLTQPGTHTIRVRISRWMTISRKVVVYFTRVFSQTIEMDQNWKIIRTKSFLTVHFKFLFWRGYLPEEIVESVNLSFSFISKRLE